MSKIMATVAVSGHHYTITTATGDADELAETIQYISSRDMRADIITDQCVQYVGGEVVADMMLSRAAAAGRA